MIVEKFTALLSKHGHSPSGPPEPDPGDKCYSPVHDRELVDADVDIVDGDILGERVAELLLRELRTFAATMEFRGKDGDYAWRVNAVFNVLEARGLFDGVARSKIYDDPIRYVPLPSALSVTQREIYDVSSLPGTLEELKARMNLNDRTR